MKHLLLILLFFTLHLYAGSQSCTSSCTDNFNGGSNNNWTYDSGANGYLRIDKNKTSVKTFKFGAANANTNVTVSLSMFAHDGWESSGSYKDKFKIVLNSNTVLNSTIPGTNGSSSWVPFSTTVSGVTDANGDIKIKLKSVTTANSERSYVDWVTVALDVTTAPTVTDATFSVSETAPLGTIVGTVLATPSPTSFTITAGNSDGIFAINASGEIRIADITNLDYESTTSYTLTVDATNTIGTGTGTITIDIIDQSAPTASDQTFNVNDNTANNTIFATIAATGNPSSFTITSGNSDNIFTTASDGSLIVDDNSNLNSNITAQYILGVDVASSEGVVSINVTINVDSALPTTSDNTRAFTNVPILGQNSVSINGTLLQIGNQVLCQNSTDGATCVDPGTTGQTQNNHHNQHKAKVDTSAGAPSNNSMAYLMMKPGDTVIFARLYWSARISGASTTDRTNAQSVQIKGPASSTYTPIKAPNSKYNWKDSSNTLGSGFFDYGASQDVTQYVINNGPGAYYVGDVEATNGNGMYASWQLVVVVQNKNRALKNISVYDGFLSLYTSSSYPTSTTVPASGFLTPTGTDPFDAYLYVYGGETDDGYADSSSIAKKDGTLVPLVDGQNDTNDVFNASVSSPDYPGGYRDGNMSLANPNFRNVLGVDIDKLQINDKNGAQILDNSQTSTSIRLASGGDRYSLNMFALETEIHYPKLCYDYTYSQNGNVYTETNDGSQYPKIIVPTNSGAPIDVTIYIKSTDNDVSFDHLSVYSDFNLSAVEYKPGYFQRTIVNAFSYEPTEGETTTAECAEVSSSSKLCKTNAPSGNFRVGLGRSVAGYPLNNSGSMLNNDFMYFKFSLSPSSGPINTELSLLADIQYSLSSGGGALLEPVRGIAFGGTRMPLCPPSGHYQPEWGIFNVIDTQLNQTQNGTAGNEYWNNLLTQVPQRPFSVDVVSLDASENPPTIAQDINTSVAVELVDIKGFHDVNISCQEPAVSFSPRVYLNFNEENRINVPNISTLYAKEDAAFRIWYIHDGNTSNLIKNWRAHTDASGALTGIENLYEQIPDAPDKCAVTCGSQSPASIRTPACYECIRSYFGYPLCSRDNFAIRPEAFALQLDDTSVNIDDNINNPSSAIRLAAGYSYSVDINATNHLNSASTPGYRRNFKTDDNETSVSLQWKENSPVVCDNENNETTAVYMGAGMAKDINLVQEEIGNYDFKVIDSNWTHVDQGLPAHHTAGAYFIVNKEDCIEYSNIVEDINATVNTRHVGCMISTSHSVDRTRTALPALSYSDLNVSYLPYTFGIGNLVLSHGSDQNSSFAAFPANTYVYMADLSVENNQSINLIGTVTADSYTGNRLRNFTTGCYAKDLNLSLNNTYQQTANINRFGLHFKSIDANSNSIINDTDSSNTDHITESPRDTLGQNFPVSPVGGLDLNGTMTVRMHYNYDRNTTGLMNPKQVTLNDFNVTCLDRVSCQMNANNITNYENNVTRKINANVVFLYGRSNIPRQRFVGPTGQAKIYYEAYDDDVTLKPLLPDGITSNVSLTSANWYQNSKHRANDGNISNIRQFVGTQVSATAPTATIPAVTTLTYDESSDYPFKTTMIYNADEWLLFDPINPNATVNEFDVEFILPAGKWMGKRVNQDAVDTTSTDTTNRRLLW